MVVAKTHEDLDAWTLAVGLRDGVFELTARERMMRHGSFCDQIQRSSASAPANIAEGFRNHLQHAKAQNYIADEDFDRLWRLSCRAIGACAG